MYAIQVFFFYKRVLPYACMYVRQLNDNMGHLKTTKTKAKGKKNEIVCPDRSDRKKKFFFKLTQNVKFSIPTSVFCLST